MQPSDLPPRTAAEAARKQFDSSMHMLAAAVDACTDEVWRGTYLGFPFPVWYQVYHAAYFVDFWFRDAYDGSDWRSMAFDGRIPPEYEHDLPAGILVSREEMRAYLAGIKVKTSRIFDSLHDSLLSRPIIAGQSDYTYLDMVMGQVRLVMYNVGYLNAVFRSLGMQESDWYAYNEQAAGR